MASTKEPVDEPVLPEEETLATFFFNKKEGTVLGRTAGSWAKIGLFYLIYYGCLAGWFAGLLHAFYSTLDDRVPTYSGVDSLTMANPGLGLRPMPLVDYTMIRFKMGIPSSYMPYTEHVKAFLETYSSPNATDCPDGVLNNGTNSEGISCKVNVEKILTDSGCNPPDYGYFAGEPCVFIKINKLFDFVPEPYSSYQEIVDDVKNSTAKDGAIYQDQVPPKANLAFQGGSVGVSCMGQNELDRAHLEVVSYAPTAGIDLKYFPYQNQPGYRTPFVAFKLKPIRHEVVQVTCKAWDLRVDNSDGQEKRGTVHFELLID